MDKIKQLIDNICFNAKDTKHTINVLAVTSAQLAKEDLFLFMPVLKIAHMFLVKNRDKYKISNMLINELSLLINRSDDIGKKKD